MVKQLIEEVELYVKGLFDGGSSYRKAHQAFYKRYGRKISKDTIGIIMEELINSILLIQVNSKK